MIVIEWYYSRELAFEYPHANKDYCNRKVGTTGVTQRLMHWEICAKRFCMETQSPQATGTMHLF